MSRQHRLPRAAGTVLVLLVTGAALAGCGQNSSAASGAAQSASSKTGAAASGDPTSSAADGASSSSPAGSGGSGSAPDPCTLVSVQQASTLTQQTFVSAEPSTIGRAKTCSYAPGGDTTETLRVTITDSSLCWGAVTSSGVTQQSVAGVGDAAFGFGTGLDVKHGDDTCIEVLGDVRAESTGDWSADVAVAQAILPKLG